MYKLGKNDKGQITIIIRVSDNAGIPLDEANTDYQAFLKYQAEGGKVYAADEEVPVNG